MRCLRAGFFLGGPLLGFGGEGGRLDCRVERGVCVGLGGGGLRERGSVDGGEGECDVFYSGGRWSFRGVAGRMTWGGAKGQL